MRTKASGRALLVVVLSCLLLTACSFAARLAYNNLDWLARRWVDDYVQFTPAQQSRFDAAFADWWHWHRQTQLPAYARSLRGLASAAGDGVTRDEMTHALEALERFMLAAMERGFGDVVDLLGELDDAQVADLLEALHDDAADYRDEVVSLPAQRRREKYARNASKLLRRWLGRLTDEQQARLQSWIEQRQDLAPQWLQSRRAWQEAVDRALQVRGRAEFASRLRPLLFDPAARWSDAHRAAVEANQQGQLDMLVDVLALAPERQLRHLQDELLRLAELCERLGG